MIKTFGNWTRGLAYVQLRLDQSDRALDEGVSRYVMSVTPSGNSPKNGVQCGK